MQEVQTQIRVYIVCYSTKYFKKQLHKKQNLGQNRWNKVFEMLGHLPLHNSEVHISTYYCVLKLLADW